MMENKKKFFTGLFMLIGFVIVLIIAFSPLLGGQNALNYMDNLYNSISKGSAYYIPKVRKAAADPLMGTPVSVTLTLANSQEAEKTAKLYKGGGAKVQVTGDRIKIEGDLGKIIQACLADADAMYYNKGDQLAGKYGYNEREVLHQWWKSFKEMEKDLKHQKKFKEASAVALTVKKAVEASYNYYGIEPQKITDRIGIVILSLLFYVIYTMWYGFAFIFMFEGLGMKLEH
ncbi:MAG: hypothetical protein JRJ82_17445 [Deltaproteobacteria bacterium]|nr:hypothetical protein [Deltaproteobacteria bacterium]